MVVIDDQPEVTIDDPAFLFENNNGFQEVTSKRALKTKLKQEAELLKKMELQQQKKRDNANKVGTGNQQLVLEGRSPPPYPPPIFKKVNIDRALSVCVSLASDFSEIIEVVIVCPSQAIPQKLLVVIKLGTVTALDRIYRVLMILTLTFIHGHTNLNHENNKCSII